MSTSNENVAFLCEMGFNESVCKRALTISKDNVQEALEWLLVHGNDPAAAAAASETSTRTTESPQTLKLSSSSSTQAAATVEAPEAETAEGQAGDEVAGANSLKCDDCGILLKDEDVATLHVSHFFFFIGLY